MDVVCRILYCIQLGQYKLRNSVEIHEFNYFLGRKKGILATMCMCICMSLHLGTHEREKDDI